jgi:KRAB domain-containing zinc finger protein
MSLKDKKVDVEITKQDLSESEITEDDDDEGNFEIECSWIKIERDVLPDQGSNMESDFNSSHIIKTEVEGECHQPVLYIKNLNSKTLNDQVDFDVKSEHLYSMNHSLEVSREKDLDNVTDQLKKRLRSYKGDTICNSNKRQIRKYQCEECGKHFLKLDVYEKHVKSHRGKTCFICTECGKEFRRKHEFQQHSRTHTGEKPHKCRFCGRTFSQKNSMKRHLTKHIELEDKVQDINDELSGKICNLCGKEFDDKKKFEIHMRKHAGVKPYVCDICQREFSQSSNYHKHLRQHSNKKSHKCPICSRGFNDSSNLQSHIRTHTGECPFVCDVCGQGFNQSTTLQMHLRTHTGYKPYTCHFCGKGCARKDALDKHLRSHTGETPYTCETCGKSFRRDDVLLRHTRLHTGEKPYKCSFCNKNFRQRAHMTNHIKLIHAKDLPFKCSLCHKAFGRKMYLTVHEKVHTPEMEHTCDRNLQREELGAVCDKKRDSTGNIEGLMDETLCNIINMSASPQKITEIKNIQNHEKRTDDGEISERNNSSLSITQCSNNDERVKKFDIKLNKEVCPVNTNTDHVNELIDNQNNVNIHGMVKNQTNENHTEVIGSEQEDENLYRVMDNRESFTNNFNCYSKKNTVSCEIDIDSKSEGKTINCSYNHKEDVIDTQCKDDDILNKLCKCAVCFREFAMSSDLKKHTKKHKEEKRYKCETCGKVFNRNSNMLKHVRIHTGERPYSCQHCGKNFSRNDVLMRHIKRLHTDGDQTKFNEIKWLYLDPY